MKINKPNILFKNVTTYTSKNYNQFLKFHNNKYEFSYNFYTIIMSILLGYCAIMNIKQKNISLIFLFSFLFIGFIASAFFNLSNIGVALVGVVIAALIFINDKTATGGTVDDNEI